MIDAVAYPVQTTRDHYVRGAVSETVNAAALTADLEDDARSLTMHAVDLILTAADAYVAALAELQAWGRRLDDHVQTHRTCRLGLPCPTLTDLKRDVARKRRECESRRSRLAKGGRW